MKVRSRRLQELLGETAKYPRWSVAIKFSPKQITTKVRDITIQVGRTGHLTPVAELEPVKISGIEIKRASLHTEDTVREKDVRVGDTVVVQRAGDVIPEVVEVIPSGEKREEPFSMPPDCPRCEATIERDGSFHLCPDISCPAQIRGRISLFASRNAFDIEGLGQKRVEQLISEGILRNMADIFTLTKERLLGLEGFAEKSAENLLEEIEKSRDISFERFINSLSIKHVGTRTAQTLAREFKTPENLMGATAEDLISVDGVGEELAQSILGFFEDPERKSVVEALLRQVRIEKEPEPSGENEKIAGKTFVLTGTLSVPREQIKSEIERLGGKVVNSVSGKTDFLVSGADPGTTKLQKARELGTDIITEEHLKSLIGL